MSHFLSFCFLSGLFQSAAVYQGKASVWKEKQIEQTDWHVLPVLNKAEIQTVSEFCSKCNIQLLLSSRDEKGSSSHLIVILSETKADVFGSKMQTIFLNALPVHELKHKVLKLSRGRAHLPFHLTGHTNHVKFLQPSESITDLLMIYWCKVVIIYLSQISSFM